MTNFIYLSSFRIFALVTSSYNISVYAKMQGIYLLLKTLLRTTLASKSFYARHFLSGRFLHFFIVANYLLRPSPIKKCEMTFFMYIIQYFILPKTQPKK